ncbi:MAG: T9SS type A sorting domain-containing protein [Bacteroidetes bacterium]|nr:T9SS type A sorting domain-containing protein [Bacteroidota bacterium]
MKNDSFSEERLLKKLKKLKQKRHQELLSQNYEEAAIIKNEIRTCMIEFEKKNICAPIKRISFFITLCTGSLASFSQNVIASGGDTYQSTIGLVSFTVGETVVETIQNTIIITQGFHQTNLTITVVEENPKFDITVYPNPTTDFFNISNKTPDTKLQLVDISGQVLLETYEDEIDLTDYVVGHYILVVSNSAFTSVYKIIKHK